MSPRVTEEISTMSQYVAHHQNASQYELKYFSVILPKVNYLSNTVHANLTIFLLYNSHYLICFYFHFSFEEIIFFIFKTPKCPKKSKMKE